MGRRPLIAILACSLGCGTAFAQEQSKPQQACINALNLSAAKVGQQQGSDNLACLKDAATGKLDMLTAQACLTADRKGKVGKALASTVEKDADKCSQAPDFAYAGSTVANEASRIGRLIAFQDVFTADADTTVIDCDADKPGCKCQRAGAKWTEALLKLKTQLFVKCKKQALKAGASSAADVAKCIHDAATEDSIAADSKSKIAKAVERLTKKIDTTCDEPGVTQDAFASHAGCSGLAGAALAGCIDRVTSCRVCQVLNTVDELTVDCDLFDNGAADATCSSLPICFPTGSACDDENACTTNDTCTAVGCNGAQLVQGAAAAITAQISPLNEGDPFVVEIVTISFKPFELIADDVTHPPGFALQSVSSVCAPHPSFPTTRNRCEHTIQLLPVAACTGTGDYELRLTHQCIPPVDGCSKCNDPRAVAFSLATENWCSEVVASCNNSQLDEGEDCDGALLGGKTCLSEGFLGGTLSCAADCSFNTGGCDAARAFVTSTTYSGDLGGLAGADDKCQARADAAGLGGTWTAWLSSSSADGRQRIPAVRYRTLNNGVITSDGSNLYGGGLAASLDRNELNAPTAATAWTGTNTDGTKSADLCGDWASTSGNGTVGQSNSAALWTNSGAGACTESRALYCFEALPYKRVFLTSTRYKGNLGGLAGGDAKCQERADAGILGGTWRAWLSTNTVHAKDRIPDAEYRLLDLSTVVASDKADLIDGTVAAHINQNELRQLQSSAVWTGTNDDGTFQGAACNNWVSQNQNIFFGGNTDLANWSQTGQIGGCSNSLRLYCFEE